MKKTKLAKAQRQDRRASKTNQPAVSKHQAKSKLLTFFERNGCVRMVDEKRRKLLGQKYKKGYEVRLTANSEEELGTMRRLLQQVGFNPGKAYKKHLQIVQPIYGKPAIEWFTGQNQNENCIAGD